MSLRRLFKRVGKAVKKVAPLAAAVGIGFALGPAGAGAIPRILGGLKIGAQKAGKIVGKIAQQSDVLGGGFTPPIVPSLPRPGGTAGFFRPKPTLTAEQALLPEQVQALPQVGSTPMFHQAQAMPPLQQPGVQQMSLLGAIPQIGRVIGRVRGALPAIRGQLPSIAGGAVAGVGLQQVVDQFGRPVRKRRRMNPYNPKAARRAIRRIKALRREMQKIERMLPKQRASTRRVRHVPSGFKHR